MKSLKLAVLFTLSIFIIFSGVAFAQSGTMKGNDGKEYKTIQIGNQVWMAENLMETRYRNGDAILEERNDYQWQRLTIGARCSYDNNAGKSDTYGYLYNFLAVNDSRNIAPPGWRVPTDDDWKELERALGMSRSTADEWGWRGSPVGSKLAGNASLWYSRVLKKHSEFGTSGFSALPAGFRQGHNGRSILLGSYAYFWLATEASTFAALARQLSDDHTDAERSIADKREGLSVRLIRD